MWPTDTLWEIGAQILTLGGILVACAIARREAGVARAWRRPSFHIEPRAKALLLVLALAALFTTCGWLGQASSLGAAQTLAMALGGPSAEEVALCQQTLARAAQTGGRPNCVFGGKVSRRPGDGWTCSKHGTPAVRTQ